MTETRAGRSLPTWRDVAATLVIVGIVVLGTTHVEDPDSRSVDALALVCGVGAAASLALWRRLAEVVTGIAGIALLVYTARDYPGGPALLVGPLALIGLGYAGSRRDAWIGAVGVMAAVTVGHRIAGGPVGANDLVVFGWAIAAVLAGQALRAREERAAVGRERAAERARQALSDERLRIAQDLHDSVAHAMATINVQSGVAAHLIDRDAAQVRESLEAIRIASRDALDELGAILGVLRQDDSEAPRQPVAGIDEVGSLVDRARTDGLAVELAMADGDVAGISRPVSAAAYRVVQEALTNTRRHAGEGARAYVTVEAGAGGSLLVRVEDDGGRSAPSGAARAGDDADRTTGFGLVGMRERVESTGGSLAVGPDGRGGYRVVAEWPPRP